MNNFNQIQVISAKSALTTIMARKSDDNVWSVWSEPNTSAAQHYSNHELSELLDELTKKGYEIQKHKTEE